MPSQFIESFLPTIQETQRLYQWIFEIVRPYIIDRVFEIHSGKGRFSSLLIDHGLKVQLNAASETQREGLRQKFKHEPLVRGIHKIDFSQPELQEEYGHFGNKFPTVLACDDFEDNIIYDIQTITNAKRLLLPGGRLMVVSQCPATFFPGADQDIDQLKRFNRDWLSNILPNCHILKIRFFDWNGTCFVAIAETN